MDIRVRIGEDGRCSRFAKSGPDHTSSKIRKDASPCHTEELVECFSLRGWNSTHDGTTRTHPILRRLDCCDGRAYLSFIANVMRTNAPSVDISSHVQCLPND